MEPVDVALFSLLLHGLLGALDTFYNHEWVERLPRRLEAQRELAFHAVRSAAFIVLFLGAAWFTWYGRWWIVLPAVIAIEYFVTLLDSIEEDRYRRLKPVERINHMLLGMNTGCYATLLVWQGWRDWRLQPDAIAVANHGLISWLLTACAVGVAAWTLRDAIASGSMQKAAASSPRSAGIQPRDIETAMDR
jgi:hypothetical protein